MIVLWGLVTHELLSSSAVDKGLDSRRRAESAWSGLGRLNRLSRGSRGRLPASRHGGSFTPPCHPINVNAPNFAIRNHLGKGDAGVCVCVRIYMCVRVYVLHPKSPDLARISQYRCIDGTLLIHEFTTRSYRSYAALSLYTCILVYGF